MQEIVRPENMPRAAMIMAAGFGKRMRPLTDNLPKPLVSVLQKPLIEYSLDLLAESGVEHAVVNSHYLAEILEEYLQQRKTQPLITISREEGILETGGGIKNALKLFDSEEFFVVNSDVICISGKIPALQRLWKNFDKEKMDALLLLHKVEDAVGYEGDGDFFIENDGSLRRRLMNEKAPFVYTGVQIISRQLFNDSPDGAFSLNLLYNKNLKSWLHVGSEKELKQAEKWLAGTA
jgi:N-acetyl-alpha-D-muramate 1-phosphate uridylyltransferase